MAELYVLEGTWEEIMLHARELSGRRLRVIVLPRKPDGAAKGDTCGMEEEEQLLDELGAGGEGLPILPEEANSRQWIY